MESVPTVTREPTRIMLLAGVAVAACLAAAGGFFFFSNVPNPGAAREQILSSSPKMVRADIDRIIAERNAFAPKPKTNIATSESVSGATAPPPAEVADDVVPAPSVEPVLLNEGDDLFRRGLYPEAIAFWRESASAGDRWSAYRLGVEYLDGKSNVVARDVAEGAKWIRISAELNEPRAQFELASLFEVGAGVPVDIDSAAKWYLKAAERGHPQGQYNIATMLETGEGVSQDKIEALKFYILAAKGGFLGVPVDVNQPEESSALSIRDLLKSQLAPSDVQEAERRASEFQPLRD